MHVGQVEFAVLATGLDNVLEKVTQLESKLNKLDTKKFDIGAKAAARQEAEALKQTAKQTQIDDKHAESIKRQNLTDAKTNAVKAKEVNDDIKALDKQTESLKRQEKTDAQTAAIKSKELDQHEESIKKQELTDARTKKVNDDNERNRIKFEQQQQDKAAKDAKTEEAAIRKEQEAARREAERAQEAQRQAYADRVQNWSRIGERMEAVGHAIQTITSPFAEIYTGFLRQAGYRLFSTVTQGLGRGFQRYDTSQMYKRMMKEYSQSSYTTQQSIDDLRESVLGLPTGLDEITGMAQRYTLSLGDMKRGTRLAIATNNAFIASMATDTQKYQGMLQLQDLMNGKELQPREWMSLGASMGKAINEIAKEMGAETQDDIRKFRQQLYAGKIDTEDFLNALEKVGNEGGVIHKLSQKMKNTWQALQDNIANANARLVENALNALNTVFKEYNGKSFLKNMQELPKYIDKIGDSLQDWIKKNPDKVTSFFESIKSIDWKGMLQGAGEFTMFWADFFTKAGNLMGGKNFSRFMLWGNFFGKALITIGQLVKGFAPVLASITGFGKLTGIFKALKGFVGHKGLGGVKDTLDDVGDAGKAASAAALSWQDVGSKAVTVLAIPAIAWSFKKAAEALETLNDVDMSFDLIGKMLLIGSALLAFVMAASSIGMALARHPAGWAAIAGTGVTAISFGSVAAAIYGMAKALDTVSKAEIPSTGRIRKVVNAIGEIGKAFTGGDVLKSISKMFDAWSVGAQAGAVEKATKAFEGIAKIGKIKLDTKLLEKAANNFVTVKEFADSLGTLFEVGDEGEGNSTYGYRLKSTAGVKSNVKSYDVLNKQVNNFASMISGYVSVFDSLKTLIQNMQGLEEMYSTLSSDSMEHPLDFSIVKSNVNSIAEAVWSLSKTDDSGFSPLEKIQKAANQIKDASTLPTALDTIKSVLKKMGELSTVGVGESNNVDLDNITTIARKVADAISILSGAVNPDIGGASGLSLNVSSIYAAVDGVKKTISTLNELSGTHVNDMTAVVDNVNRALDTLRGIGYQYVNINVDIDGVVNDFVSAKIQAAADNIQKVWDTITDLEKSIKIKIKNGGVTNTALTAVKNASNSIWSAWGTVPTYLHKTVNVDIDLGKINKPDITKLNDPLNIFSHTGGLITNHGVRYRQFGGFIPRGTDTVPAMLTPGEYVINRRAADALGTGVLQRLNHLDIRGAITALASRAGHQLAPSVVNNTRNEITINNNTPSGNVGLNRASRWVKGLSN